MADEYGKKLTAALAAVRRLHSDTSKLMVDFDGKMIADGWSSVFDNTATGELTYSVKAQFWMAQAVWRYYAKDGSPGYVEGLTVVFFRERTEEPLFLVAQVQYHLGPKELVSSVCRVWDIWYLYFKHTDKRDLEAVNTFRDIENGRIEKAAVLAVPLLSIKTLADAVAALNKVREAGF
jgi:hypothetical protein